MEYEIQDGRLVITVDQQWKAIVLADHAEDEDFDSDDRMRELLETLVCNSELGWVDPADTGDLSDAPMLGMFGEELSVTGGRRPADVYEGLCHGFRHVGGTGASSTFEPVLARWAFMDYEVGSVQRHLLQTGRAVFVSSC